ncbi:hypothetical protein QBC36DRAFT_391519 [Triangularia setosa]|uniref:Uncharacterized protein n=1 Tax=Triangularia setosa TaxID=2587417 RepID=A0AAN7A0C9_9PEZI|nr:hypothetical protein QBC36DRAFT_391519 [Podospora setosa]
MDLRKRQLLAVVGKKVPIYNTQEESFSSSSKQKNQQLVGHRSTMYQLFREFRGFRATDPRDKVYALVGLAENVEYTLGPLPVIAYSPDITVFDVVWNILAVEIRNNRSLAFLSDACGIKKPEGFASWMPLWDDQVPPPLTVIGKPTKLLGLQMGHVIYKASGATQTAVQIVKDDKLLAVTGAKCAVVTDIGDVFDRDLPAMNRLAARKKWALMLGVDALDLLAHVLTSLQIVGYFSEKEAELRWALSAKKHTQKQKLLYERFFATIMGSASSEGTRSFWIWEKADCIPKV